MKLEPHETEIIGKWKMDGNQIHSDVACNRIEQLTAKHLKQIAVSKQWGAWETLFQDPNDGSYWERTYPQGELQGGGPPKLSRLSAEAARIKYGDMITHIRIKPSPPIDTMSSPGKGSVPLL